MSRPREKQSDAEAQQQSVPEPSREIQHVLDELKTFREVPMDLSIELGRGKLKLRDLLKLHYHSVFALDTNAGGKLNLYVNGVLLGRGEPVVVDNQMGIRIDEIAEPEN